MYIIMPYFSVAAQSWWLLHFVEQSEKIISTHAFEVGAENLSVLDYGFLTFDSTVK